MSPRIGANLTAAVFAWVAVAAPGFAAPVFEPWAMASPSAANVSVAAAGLSGLRATLDGAGGTVEVYDLTGAVVRTISLGQIASAVGGIDTGAAVLGRATMSESGRLLFVVVQNPPTFPGGVAARTDDVIRIDVDTGAMTRFVSVLSSGAVALGPTAPVAHWAGRLYVGLGTGGVLAYSAARNDLTGGGSPLAAYTLLGGVRITALTVDRLNGDLYASLAGGALYRVRLSSGVVATVGSLGTGVAGLAYSEQYGGAANGGLYALTDDRRLLFLTPAQARGTSAFGFGTYGLLPATPSGTPTSLSATADGRLMLGAPAGAALVSDDSDTRLSFAAWKSSEFQQVVLFCKGLISPDPGQQAGWVIDADTWPQWARFHPATADGACWVVLVLMMNDELTPGGDPQALPLIRTILTRYAGLTPGGGVPDRNADGIYQHWLNPANGTHLTGWGDTYSTLSTMHIVAAAARALQRWPQDAQISAACNAIICGVHDLDSYVRTSDKRIALSALGGAGGGTGGYTSTHNETLVFAEQAAWNGGAGRAVYQWWIDRSHSPTATFVTGRPVSGDSGGNFLPVFTSAYPMLLMNDFRSSSAWGTQMENIRVSAAAWTDDNGPRWYTVFSAGTNPDGYFADALNNSPYNISTFPALMALCGQPGAGPSTPSVEAAAAYHAYRAGARQTFRTGASLLYRRSSTTPTYTPNSAGLTDVALGALGLAELLSPGAIDRVLTGRYPACNCRSDVGVQGGSVGRDGLLDNNDFVSFIAAFFGGDYLVADVGVQGGTPGRDGLLDNNDFVVFISEFFQGC